MVLTTELSLSLASPPTPPTFFYLMYVSVLPTCIYVNHVCAVPVKDRRGHWIPGTEVTNPIIMLEADPVSSGTAASDYNC